MVPRFPRFARLNRGERTPPAPDDRNLSQPLARARCRRVSAEVVTAVMKRQLGFHRPPFFIPFFLSGPHLGTYHFWVEGFQREGAPSKTVETPWINATPLVGIWHEVDHLVRLTDETRYPNSQRSTNTNWLVCLRLALLAAAERFVPFCTTRIVLGPSIVAGVWSSAMRKPRAGRLEAMKTSCCKPILRLSIGSCGRRQSCRARESQFAMRCPESSFSSWTLGSAKVGSTTACILPPGQFH